MPTAREETTRLADLLRSEHHAMADFLIALAEFDAARRWEELGHNSLFSFLTRELRLSAGAAQYRKTAAELIQRIPEVEAALRRGDLCLSSTVEVSKVITPENAAEVLPRFFGKSSRDAAFVAASIRPVENPPRRDFVVTPVRSEPMVDVGAATPGVFRAPEVASPSAPPSSAPAPVRLTAADDRFAIRPLDAERARMNITVSRRLLDKLAAARRPLSLPPRSHGGDDPRARPRPHPRAAPQAPRDRVQAAGAGGLCHGHVHVYEHDHVSGCGRGSPGDAATSARRPGAAPSRSPRTDLPAWMSLERSPRSA